MVDPNLYQNFNDWDHGDCSNIDFNLNSGLGSRISPMCKELSMNSENLIEKKRVKNDKSQDEKFQIIRKKFESDSSNVRPKSCIKKR